MLNEIIAVENKIGWPDTLASHVYPLSARPIRGQYPGHVITLSQSEANVYPLNARLKTPNYLSRTQSSLVSVCLLSH